MFIALLMEAGKRIGSVSLCTNKGDLMNLMCHPTANTMQMMCNYRYTAKRVKGHSCFGFFLRMCVSVCVVCPVLMSCRGQ